jgi:peptidoglycan/xylan/chitin deacetylase (PgdA/CDA1 family)
METGDCVFLMYHELELSGRPLCQSAPGYRRYVLSNDSFRRQMQWIKESGYRGLSVGEALQYPSGRSVCITFDDGCETDLIAAAPILRDFGFRATFYLTAGFVGTPGYLKVEQVRELDAAGFEIGCHSMTHPYLSDLDEAGLKREIMDAKLHVEQIVGHPIEHFSLPGGRYDSRTLDMARRAGFRTVATSLFHANSASTSPYKLGRVAIHSDTPLEEFAAICEGHGLWRKRFHHRARQALQLILGNHTYDQVRALLLGEKQQ